MVPQHPPAKFTNPACANSFSKLDVTSGVSSKPVSLIGFGKPAFGYHETYVSQSFDNSAIYGLISAAPNAQFKPNVNGRA